jgi:hypothetical protein
MVSTPVKPPQRQISALSKAAQQKPVVHARNLTKVLSRAIPFIATSGRKMNKRASCKLRRKVQLVSRMPADPR